LVLRVPVWVPRVPSESAIVLRAAVCRNRRADCADDPLRGSPLVCFSVSFCLWLFVCLFLCLPGQLLCLFAATAGGGRLVVGGDHVGGTAGRPGRAAGAGECLPTLGVPREYPGVYLPTLGVPREYPGVCVWVSVRVHLISLSLCLSVSLSLSLSLSLCVCVCVCVCVFYMCGSSILRPAA
jgi:hypothetical protein